MSSDGRFLALMAISLAVLAIIIRQTAPPERRNMLVIILVSAAIAGGGMLYARWSATSGLPVALYYAPPALATMLLPPLIFRIPPVRAAIYVVLAFLSAPAIHYGALWLLGWDEYLPALNALWRPAARAF